MNPLTCIFSHRCVIYNRRSRVCFTAIRRKYRINPLNTIRVLIVSTRDIYVHFNPYRRTCRKIGGKTYDRLIITVRIRRLLRTCRHCRTNVRFVCGNYYVLISERFCRREIRCCNIYCVTIGRYVKGFIFFVVQTQYAEVSYGCEELKVQPFANAFAHRCIIGNRRRVVYFAASRRPYRIYPFDSACAVHRTRYVNVHFNIYERTYLKVGRKTYKRLTVLFQRARRFFYAVRHTVGQRNLNVSIIECCCGFEIRREEINGIALTHRHCFKFCIRLQYGIISYRCLKANLYPSARIVQHLIKGNYFYRIVYFATLCPRGINPLNGRGCPFVIIFVRCRYTLGNDFTRYKDFHFNENGRSFFIVRRNCQERLIERLIDSGFRHFNAIHTLIISRKRHVPRNRVVRVNRFAVIPPRMEEETRICRNIFLLVEFSHRCASFYLHRPDLRTAVRIKRYHNAIINSGIPRCRIGIRSTVAVRKHCYRYLFPRKLLKTYAI